MPFKKYLIRPIRGGGERLQFAREHKYWTDESRSTMFQGDGCIISAVSILTLMYYIMPVMMGASYQPPLFLPSYIMPSAYLSRLLPTFQPVEALLWLGLLYLVRCWIIEVMNLKDELTTWIWINGYGFYFYSMPAQAYSKMTNVKVHHARIVKEWFSAHETLFSHMDCSPV